MLQEHNTGEYRIFEYRGIKRYRKRINVPWYYMVTLSKTAITTYILTNTNIMINKLKLINFFFHYKFTLNKEALCLGMNSLQLFFEVVGGFNYPLSTQCTINLKYDYLLMIIWEVLPIIIVISYILENSAESCILLMEHKTPPPYFWFLFIFCFYAYFRLGKG